MAQSHVVVIGAGMVGVSCAIWLARSGFDVTLVDKEGPAAGASHGNAGVLASASIVPLNTPGLLAKIPAMVLNPDSPLFLRWSYLPRLMPFLARFLRHANDAQVRRAATSLSAMLFDAADQHLALAEGTGAERFISRGDFVFGYRDEASYRKDAYGFDIKRAFGHPVEELDAAAFDAYDPTFQGRFGYGVRLGDNGRISDPGAYIRALADHAEALGVRLHKAEVTAIRTEKGRAVAVATPDGEIDADHVVLTTGAWSKRLAESLGVSVPLETERGYHVEFLNPSIVPRSPTMVASGSFVLTPMDGRLRAAGIVEFGGMTKRKSARPLELLMRQTKAALPELTYDSTVDWVGFRPTLPDSLPAIGPFSAVPNVHAGFGHQHVGLTAGPKTGRWLASLISGDRPNVDLAPFAPNRFTAR